MNQRTFLGLSHNPFTPPREGFFTGGDRKTHLDHLRHLSQWSRRVLVVTGPFGIGKSSLFRELSGSLEPNTKAARISGTVVTSEREILVGLLQGFGIAADLDTHADDLARLIAEHANEQETHGRVCMVMADDAHLLEVQAVQRLVGLVAASSLRMLFFAEASLINNLDRAARKQDIEWFEIRLTGFPKSDVRNYLEWRFRQAHYRGLLPFTDEQVEKIVARSSGNPSVIDSMANRLLADMESGEIRNQSGGFPTTHVTLGFLLMVMIGLVYLYVQDEPEGVVSDATESVVAQVANHETPVDDVVTEDGLTTNPDLASDDLADELQELQGQQEQQEQQEDSQLPVVDEDQIAAVVDNSQALENADDQAAAEVSGADDPAVADTSVEVVEPVILADLSGQTSDDTSDDNSDVTSANISANIEPFNSAQWILRQDPNRYTMQLLTLSTRERAVQFIGRQLVPEEFGLYRLQRDEKLLHVVTYGVFSSRIAAQSAGQAFSGELASLTPWIRPLSLVQDAIRTSPQE
jgi:type II secretory pathway predicted ATPase ExeA/septal ring-binding cell division protein DamX